MRLIDADAIEYTHAIARSLDDGHNWNELCVTKDEIEDMPAIQPERITSRWIPCGKRLPENDNDVLVQMNDGSMMVDYRAASSNGWFWAELDDEPVAWMPLPEPYKGVTE